MNSTAIKFIKQHFQPTLTSIPLSTEVQMRRCKRTGIRFGKQKCTADGLLTGLSDMQASVEPLSRKHIFSTLIITISCAGNPL